MDVCIVVAGVGGAGQMGMHLGEDDMGVGVVRGRGDRHATSDAQGGACEGVQNDLGWKREGEGYRGRTKGLLLMVVLMQRQGGQGNERGGCGRRRRMGVGGVDDVDVDVDGVRGRERMHLWGGSGRADRCMHGCGGRMVG